MFFKNSYKKKQRRRPSKKKKRRKKPKPEEPEGMPQHQQCPPEEIVFRTTCKSSTR
jgi:hypothetical protein